MLNECSGLFGPPDYCLFKVLAREQVCFRVLAVEAAPLCEHDVWCRQTASHQAASVNTEQSAAAHFKAQPRVLGGGVLFNLRILFVKLMLDSWSASRHQKLPHRGFTGGLLPFCRALRTPQKRPWKPVSAVWWGWFLVVWASWSPCCRRPSPGWCLSPAWCPTLHHRFSLQKEASADGSSI